MAIFALMPEEQDDKVEKTRRTRTLINTASCPPNTALAIPSGNLTLTAHSLLSSHSQFVARGQVIAVRNEIA